MSIFKDSFKQNIQEQLKARQDALVERTPSAIQYLNSRNAWIRMTSAVDTVPSLGAEPTNDLAKKYILQGGILNDKSFRSGIGSDNNAAYSTISPGGVTNRLGIRPMPGITGIDVKSKSAYGSLREVTVKFQCWDIRQLEDLELLYMRPGYTVLIEWGWIPYLTNTKGLSNIIEYYDIINKTPTKDQIFKDLYEEAVKTYNGNYDAMYGYVKNYGWNARADGGYDCTTTIISLGEVLQSLKVNYAPYNVLNNIKKTGLIAPKVEGITTADLPNLDKIYSKNILAGLFYELYTIGVKKELGKDQGKNLVIKDTKGGKNSYYDLFGQKINIEGGENAASSKGKIGASDEQIYITLEGLCNLINNYVTFIDSNSKEAYVKCSVLDRNSSLTPNPLTGDGYLLCLAHPLQISVDPRICVIQSPIWSNGFKVNTETITGGDGANVVTFPSKLTEERLNSVVDQLIYVSVPTKKIKNEQAVVDYLKRESQGDADTVKAITSKFLEKLRDPNYKIAKPAYTDLINDAIDEGDNIDNAKLGKSLPLAGVASGISLYTFLSTDRFTNLTPNQINEAFGANEEFTKSDPVATEQAALDKEKQKLENTQNTSIEALQYLKNIQRPYFYQKKWETELGIIGNIYVNLNFLYRLALDNNLESLDTKEKKDINLYDFLKNVLSEISASTGNVNNFDLFVENDKIYIIDVNYVDTKLRSDVYDKLFQLELHNLKSTVRSYKLESQIFPDQSATIAIGAQVGGGAMATDNNTILDFNRGLKDRIIPKKDDPIVDPNQSGNEKILSQLQNVNNSLQSLYQFFGDLKYGWLTDANFNTEEASDYKNSLKDLINFFKNLTKSDIKNRAIIPTKFSATMDGIGGLVIGHLFKIPEDLLPRGYQGETLGSKLGYTITGIGHSINNNDWTTTIDAQTIILDEPSGNNPNFKDIIIITPDGKTETKNTANNEKIKSTSTKINPKNIPPDLIVAMKSYGIVSPIERAHFLSNVAHESGDFSLTQENLNYSSAGLLRTFPRYFNEITAIEYAFKPDRIANRVYANRLGNGSEASGEGYKYRGRGYIQLTGKDNYILYNNYLKQRGIKDDVVINPDLVATKYAADSSCYWWKQIGKVTPLAIKGPSFNDVASVRKRVNGGNIGLSDVQSRFNGYWGELQQNPNAFT